MTASRRRRESPAERRERRAAVTDVTEVLDAAARFLEARQRSTAEVRRRLTGAGYRPELVEEAVARLAGQGYLDDEAFARAWVESRDRARPRGERALRGELLAKGVDRSIIDLVLSERVALPGSATLVPESRQATGMDSSADEAAARRLLERHRRALEREPDPVRRRQKAYALLARNGFDPDVCRTVAGSFAEAVGTDDPEPG